MKKLLLSLLICLLLPCLTFAAPEATTYTNQEHNFQITLPRGWKAINPPDSRMLCAFTDGTSGSAEEGIFIWQPQSMEKFPPSFTFADLSDENKQGLINTLAEKLPSHKITSTQYTYLGGNYALIALMEKHSDIAYQRFPTYASFCFFVHNRAGYVLFLGTNKQDQLPLLQQVVSNFKYITPPKADTSNGEFDLTEYLLSALVLSLICTPLFSYLKTLFSIKIKIRLCWLTSFLIFFTIKLFDDNNSFSDLQYISDQLQELLTLITMLLPLIALPVWYKRRRTNRKSQNHIEENQKSDTDDL